MPGLAAKVIITERQQEVLQSMVWSRSCPQGLAHRAEIILLAFEGLKNEVIAERLGCERHGVGLWRRRWKKAFDQLVRVECLEKSSALPGASGQSTGDSEQGRLPATQMFTAVNQHSDDEADRHSHGQTNDDCGHECLSERAK